MKSYDVILFDLDGTITDSSEGITNSVKYMLKQYGIEENDMSKLCQFIGPPLIEPLQEMYGFSEEGALEAVAQYRVYYQDTGIFENRVYEGFEEVLKILKEKGKKVLVATSKPEVYARKIMDYFKLTKYFDYVAGAGMDERHGSKAAVIQHAFDECGIKDKSQVLMVGDRKYDVNGAKQMGVDCMGILYGFGSREELEAAGATYIVDTVRDLEEVFREME